MKDLEILDNIIGVIAIIGLIIFYYLLSCLWLWIISLLFGFTFTWILAFKVWVAIIIIKIFF